MVQYIRLKNRVIIRLNKVCIIPQLDPFVKNYLHLCYIDWRVWYRGCASVFQTVEEGSSPSACSKQRRIHAS